MQILKKGAKKEIISTSLRIYFFMIVFLIALIIFLFLFLKFESYIPSSSARTCGDGSLYGTCSISKPYYCSNGTLYLNSSVCGCPEGTSKKGDSCVSKYQTNAKNLTLNYVLDGVNGSVNFTAYKGMDSYLSTLPESIYYSSGQVPQRSDFVLKQINNNDQSVLLEPLVKDIENLAPTDKVNQARIAVSLVQNIPWGASGKTISFLGSVVGYSRYPYQVVYDNQGLCGEKSELLAFILRDMGYGVALFYYPQQNHEAVGVKCPMQDSFNETGYCFVETSGPAIISDSHLVYADGITLNTTPQLVILSEGISLPSNLQEYKDAKTLDALRQRILLDPISSHILNTLKKKYGLPEVYNIN